MATLLTPARRRALAWLVGIFALIFGTLQFVRPTLSNPPVTADLAAPDDVKAILKTSCYNCHSNETQIPWFDKVVPAYWLVVRDVKHGRVHLNFSNFGKLSADKQKAMLYESVNMVMLGAMPPVNYRIVHPGSTVTSEQLDVLKNYLHPATPPVPTPEEAAKREQARQTAGQDAEQQYLTWITNTSATPPKVAPEFNGLAFFPDYKNWRPVSTTDRFDNDTFRVILGNDIAQRAIADNQIHPWPDGATFAKIAWKQHEADDGTLHSGSFLQVEFMTKDAKKYASTQGWGFGRWRGVDYKPYGKSASFTVECTSCHAPMKDNDFVYTMPIHDASAAAPDLFNRQAALPAGLPSQPFAWRVLTSSANKRDHTMSTLYGNDAAVAHARSGSQDPYPAGSVLALATWDQKDDMHWFGGRIPGAVHTVEFVTSVAGADGKPVPSYEIYSGSPLIKSTSSDAAANQPRIEAITQMEAAVMP